MSTSGSPPQSWLCPILYTVMRDPVIAPDARTYERSAIQEWIRIHGTSPFTRQPMSGEDLIPNMALREAIDESESNTASSHLEYVPESALSERPLITSRRTIHCLVDRSGSMGIRISTPGYEQDGFTRLDLVKHTLLTLIHSLPSDYSLSITTFDSASMTILGVTPMDVQGKTMAIRAVETITPGSTTNIWDGFRQVLSLAEDGSSPTIILFTDGESNINPPRGICNTLQTHLTEREITPTIHTMGYGYEIASQLLHKIAHTHNGLFGFIPDCTMIGSVFINILAKLMEMTEHTTMTPGADYLVTPKCPPLVQYLLDETTRYLHPHEDDRRGRIEQLKDWIDAMPTTRDFTDEYKRHLLVDIEDGDPDNGQISKAVSREDWYSRWGAHYLRSLHLAHLRGVCVNFKDASLQHYKSARFIELQNRMESIFVSLPSPEPSASPARGTRSFGSVASPPRAGATPMSVYYDDSAGCFTGDTLVLTKQTTGTVEYRPISSLSPGDVVATTWNGYDYEYSRIKFMVQYVNLTTDVCTLGDGLRITKYHPVRRHTDDTSEWEFPKNIVSPEKTTVTLYNMVLESGHMVRCKEYECVTLGHYMTDNAVVEHSYFGTDAVVKDISDEHIRQGGNGISGTVIIHSLRTQRDLATGYIVRYVFNE